MLKLIKMDLYRMFHTKAFYIIWIILGAAVIFSTTMSKEDYQYMQEEAAKGQLETVSEEGTLNFGLSVSLPTKPEFCQYAVKIYCPVSGDFYCIVFHSGSYKRIY